METRSKLDTDADPLRAMIGMGKAAGAGKGKAKPMAGNGVGPLLRASELSSPGAGRPPAAHLRAVRPPAHRQRQRQAPRSPRRSPCSNGFIDAEVMAERSLLTATIGKVADPADKVRALFLMILARQPSDKELGLVMKSAAAGGKDAIADIAWSLLIPTSSSSCARRAAHPSPPPESAMSHAVNRLDEPSRRDFLAHAAQAFLGVSCLSLIGAAAPPPGDPQPASGASRRPTARTASTSTSRAG